MRTEARPRPPEANSARSPLRWLVPVGIALAYLAFRVDALLRVGGPLIADGTEYLLIVHDLLTGSHGPISVVRNCFFSSLVAGQFLLQGLFLDGTFGAASGRVLPLFCHLLATFGAYRLGREVHDRRAGALAALFVGVQPAFGYWATDCLTDVPAAACFVWAVLCWVRGKPTAAGVLLGVGVLLRYQALVGLAAFLGVVMISKRRRSLARVLPGLLLIPLGVGVLDALFWGTPFASLMAHFTVFTGHFDASVGQAVADGAAGSVGPLARARGVLDRAIHSRFVLNGPAELSWILTALFLSWPIARRWTSRRGAGDFAFGVGAASFLLLALFAYSDLRYLTSILPVVASIAAAAAVPWAEGLGSLVGLAREAAGRRSPAVALVLLGIAFATWAWVRQQRLPYRPYVAVLEATEDALAREESTVVGLLTPWVPAHENPIERIEAGIWFTGEGDGFISLPYLDERCEGGLSAGGDSGMAERMLRELDYVVVGGWHPRWEEGSFLWRHLNGRLVLDEVRYDPSENVQAAWRFRVVEPDTGDSPLFRVLDEAPAGDALGEFAGGISLLEVTATFEPQSPGALRFDFTWALDESVVGVVRAQVRLLIDGVIVETPDEHCVLPPGAGTISGIARPGAAIRVSRYYEAAAERGDSNLTIGVSLFAARDDANPGASEPVGLKGISASGEPLDVGPELLLLVTPHSARTR